MANLQTLRTHIQNLIAKDDFATAIQELCALLKNSPRLDEAILHSARYNDITRQIRLGVVDFEAGNVTKNQICVAVLELLQEVADLEQMQVPIKEEVAKYTSNAKTIIQNADKIYNIDKIDNANFS